MIELGFDFSGDPRSHQLAWTDTVDPAKAVRVDGDPQQKRRLLEAATTFDKTLALESENVTAHHNLYQIYEELGDNAKVAFHNAEHLKFKPDNNAQGRAVGLARAKYPAANFAAEALVIYPVQRDGAPGLDAKPVAIQRPHLPTTSRGD